MASIPLLFKYFSPTIILTPTTTHCFNHSESTANERMARPTHCGTCSPTSSTVLWSGPVPGTYTRCFTTHVGGSPFGTTSTNTGNHRLGSLWMSLFYTHRLGYLCVVLYLTLPLRSLLTLVFIGTVSSAGWGEWSEASRYVFIFYLKPTTLLYCLLRWTPTKL